VSAAASDTGIRAAGAGRFELYGDVNFQTARSLRVAGLRLLQASSAAEMHIDCAHVRGANSAAVALFIDWLGWARGAGRSLNYERLPDNVRAIARISEVEELLEAGIDARAQGG